jgi:dihydroorotase
MRILHGKVWYNNQFTTKDLLVTDGKIAKIANSISPEEDSEGNESDIDARGLLVLPGLIDLHVHLREPGFDYKEDFFTGTRAAVAGGITHVFDMPNNKIPVTTAKLLREKIELAKKKAVCNVSFYVGASKGNEKEWKKIANEERFAGLKIYMGKTTGDLLVDSDALLEPQFAEFDPKRYIVVHAEDERKGGMSLESIERAGKLAKKYGKQLHIAHITTKEEIRMAKKYPKTTVETGPHYLFIDEPQLTKLGELKGVNPPVRGNAERVELMRQVVEGKVDCISTDHAPHTLEDKKNGAKGYPGLETSLALMVDASNRRLMPIELVPKMMAENPARIANLAGSGIIVPKLTANLTIVDPKREWTVKGEELETKCKWSPFEGRKLKGKAVKTIIEGETVYESD